MCKNWIKFKQNFQNNRNPKIFHERDFGIFAYYIPVYKLKIVKKSQKIKEEMYRKSCKCALFIRKK